MPHARRRLQGRTLLATVTCLLALAGMPTAARARAGSQWYDVELIVFRNVSPQGLSTELWPSDPRLPDTGDAVSLKPFNGSRDPQPFSRLPASAFRLDGVWKALQQSANYQPLLHVAWTQPGYPPGKAQAVRIHGSRRISLPTAAPASDQSAQPGPAGATGVATGGTAPGRIYRLDGTVRLSLLRYLHLDTDLIYSQLKSEGAGANGTGGQGNDAGTNDQSPGMLDQGPGTGPRLVRYPLHQERRMRSGQLNYLDNPRFGVLVLVTPRS